MENEKNMTPLEDQALEQVAGGKILVEAARQLDASASLSNVAVRIYQPGQIR